METEILKSQIRLQTVDGVRESPDTVSKWYGLELPSHISYVGEETVHRISVGVTLWRCWWRYANGNVESIVIDADIPHEERIQTAFVNMRMSDGNDSQREGGSSS